MILFLSIITSPIPEIVYSYIHINISSGKYKSLPQENTAFHREFLLFFLSVV